MVYGMGVGSNEATDERKTKTMSKKYQIFCDRGNGLELDGCWGSENAQFTNQLQAIDSADELAKTYSDCDWVVADLRGEREFYRHCGAGRGGA